MECLSRSVARDDEARLLEIETPGLVPVALVIDFRETVVEDADEEVRNRQSGGGESWAGQQKQRDAAGKPQPEELGPIWRGDGHLT